VGLLQNRQNNKHHNEYAAVVETAFSAAMQDLLQAIADPNTDATVLTQAIRALGASFEDPQFWIRIASSDRYSRRHRRRAVLALFQRHVRVPLTLDRLARVLDQPTWLESDDVAIVTDLAGGVPVRFDSRDTVFVIRVLPDSSREGQGTSGVYFSVEGKLGLEEFRNAVFGRESDPAVRERQVTDVGFSEDRSAL
jgi:hypothetical protein